MGFFRKGKWSLRSREGPDTPSFEELFYYLVTPGGVYHTLTSDNDPELLDYYVISGLVTVGGFALASNAILAAEAAGTTAMYSEFVMWRGIQTVTKIPVVMAGVGLLALQLMYARDLAKRDYKFKMKHGSGMDPGSMTQPISPMHDFGGNPGGPSGAGY